MHHNSLLDRAWFQIMAFVAICGGIILLWLIVPAFQARGLTMPQDASGYGDTFGGVNALFTGLAFAGLCFTILLQLRQLHLQRLDFLHQLDEMRQSREEVEEQNRLIQMQVDADLLTIRAMAMNFLTTADEIEYGTYTKGTRGYDIRLGNVRGRGDELLRRVEAIQVTSIPSDSSSAG